jgi:hypothetical protein
MQEVHKLLMSAKLERYEGAIRALGIINVDDLRAMDEDELELELGLNKIEVRRLRRLVGTDKRRLYQIVIAASACIVFTSLVYVMTSESSIIFAGSNTRPLKHLH